MTQDKCMTQNFIEESIWKPQIYRQRNDSDDLACLIRTHPRLQKIDTLASQVRELIRIRCPERRLLQEEVDQLAKQHLAGSPLEECGAWIYYPWTERLVHLLDRDEFAELRTNRNRYKITPGEQALLATKAVGVVGLSVGQSVSLTMALERSFAEIRLADFDTIDLSNLNRLRTGVYNLLLPKVIVTAREIMEIDPYLSVRIFPDGIIPENLDLFLTGGGPLDVVIEECDSLDVKCLVREGARRHRIPVVMETSDRGRLDIERFDLEPDRPIFHGLIGDVDPRALGGLTTEEKIPYILRINGEHTLSTRLRASLVEVDETIPSWPQLASAVSLGAGLAADAARRILLNDHAPSGRYFFDIDARASGNSAISPLPHDSEVNPRITVPHVNAPPGAITLNDSIVRSFVETACLAPSGGNTQPWLWIANGRNLSLFLDEGRSLGVADHEFGGSYAALGAATENLRLSVQNCGLELLVRTFPSQADLTHAATFHFLREQTAETEAHWGRYLFHQIPLRHTNRKVGNLTGLPESALISLAEAIRSIPGADVQWLTIENQLERIADLIGAADRLRMLDPEQHHAMYKELRWNREDAESRRDGIEVESFHLSQTDRAGLLMCSDWPSLDFLREENLGRKLESISRRSVRSASAVGLLTMPQSRLIDYFNGGRALQRMWLVATEQNIAIHPMTVLPYFLAVICRGNGRGLSDYTIAGLRRVLPEYRELFPIGPLTAEVLLFRVSRADSVEVRSLRRQVEQVLRFVPNAGQVEGQVEIARV
jgi:hypothetical protein